MKVIRYFAQESQWLDNKLTLPVSDYNHIIGSLRLVIGETLSIIIDNKRQIDGVITAIHKPTLTLSVSQDHRLSSPAYTLDLGLCLTKSDAFTKTLHDCTQLPITGIRPLMAQYSIPKLSDATAKHTRWQRIIHQASCQSRRQYLPQLHHPENLLTSLNTIAQAATDYDAILVCDECETDRILGDCCAPTYKRLLVVIGPEGGFSPEERHAYSQLPAVYPVSIGATILKAPQAAFYALSVLSHCYATLYR